MRLMGVIGATAAAVMTVSAVPAIAETPRDILTQASFSAPTKADALQRIAAARRATIATLARSPNDHEALIIQATALAYQAKMTGSRGGVIAARKQFEALVARFPNDPEPLLGVGALHMGAVYKLGRFVARAAVGAQKDVGLRSLDRAVALGGDRAMYAGLAGLLRLEQDPTDARGVALVEQASRAGTPSTFDRVMKRAAGLVLTTQRSGNSATTKALAARLLPFGQFGD